MKFRHIHPMYSMPKVLLMFCFLSLFSTTGKGQSIATEKVTLGLRNESMETAIKRIEQQSVFRFFYRNEDIRPLAHLNLTSATRTIAQTLDALLQSSPLSFRQIDKHILLERRGQHSAYEIRGRVLDSTDRMPIANASVFLSNATIGCRTAADGTFVLHGVTAGKYDLVVSSIGFGTYNQSIIVTDSNIASPDIVLSTKIIALTEVKIKFDPNREKYLMWFKDEFLGISDLAGECKILNPEVLDLNYDETTNRLTASSYDFLEIENRALGYKIKYLLTDFSFQKKAVDKKNILYKGAVLFEELKGTPREERRWKRNRQNVYQNSPMHFLRSAVNNRLNEDGFRVQAMVTFVNPERPPDSLIIARIGFYKQLKAGDDSLSYWIKKSKLPGTVTKLMPSQLSKKDIIQATYQPGRYALAYNADALYVAYSKNHHFYTNDHFKDLYNPGNDENTLVKFNTPRVFFYSNGVIANPYSVMFYGAWAKNRVAGLLPLDYEPPAGRLKSAGDEVIQNNDVPRQSNYLQVALLKLKTTSDSINAARPPETAYLQFDKPYYAINDTVWFKAYLLKTSFLTPSAKSGILYVDIANDSNKVVKQYRFAVSGGLSWGNISLSDADFTPGTYTLRAYTNWMRNWGDKGFFYKQFYVGSAGENMWLVNDNFTLSGLNDAQKVSAKLLFTDINKKPSILTPMELQVISESKRMYRQKLQTGVDGRLDINFAVPQKAGGLALVAESTDKSKKVVIPVMLNRPEKADVQFLPEGGSMVAGLPARIGFKAIGEDGKGITVSGVVIDHSQKQVATFRSYHKGMGSFELAVQAGEGYTAKATLPGGLVKEFLLPAVKISGIVLHVKNDMRSDSVDVSIGATADIVQTPGSYFLIGEARGVVCYAAMISFKKGSFVERRIAKNLFPTGIAHFILMTATEQPLNERLVFIDHNDNLNIQITTGKAVYAARDSIALHVKVTDNTGQPVAGNFSLAVTDDEQVKTDTLNAQNILTRLLLTSNLKGCVEEPGYYRSAKTNEASQALDDLLLTQGWTGYDLRQMTTQPKVSFEAEENFKISGQVVNVFNKPVRGTKVQLFSKSPAILMDTLTDVNGRFAFNNLPAIDTPIFMVQAVNRGGKSFNVGVNIDEITPPAFVKPACPLLMPWYINSDTTLLNLAKANARAKELQYFPENGQVLKEVKVTATKIIKDSQNLNGPGNADLVLDEKDMEKAGKKTIFDVLQEKIPGFKEGGVEGFIWYYVQWKPVFLLIDGTPLMRVIIIHDFNDFRRYLQSHTAEDIKGVEVNFTGKYVSYYERRFNVQPGTCVFIEITTRSGHGPVIDNTPGTYLYKPLAFSFPAQFYKPRYMVADTVGHLHDLRSTIDWEPNIVTNKNGEATVNFYAADKAGTYTIITEGTDMQGNLGYMRSTVTIKTKADVR